MRSTQGFVDLRVTPQGQGSHSDDSVWPSFTDIMTVVVMIFLMSLVVILIRNVDLVKELRSTIDKERETAEIARSTAIQKVALEERLDQLERDIVELQLNLRAVNREKESATAKLEVSNENVTRLTTDIVALETLRDRLLKDNEELAQTRLALSGRLQLVETAKDELALENLKLEDLQLQLSQEKATVEQERDKLSAEKISIMTQLLALQTQSRQLAEEKAQIEVEKAGLQTEKETISGEFDVLKAVYALLQTEQKTLEERFEDAKDAVETLEEQYANIEQRLEVETAKVLAGEEKFTGLQVTFEDLEAKYLKLVGPARSELDKYVVEIRYRKIGNAYVYEYREPNAVEPVKLSLEAIRARLSEHKARDPKKLYTKIVIPDNSGLSYTEAWNFTWDILRNYDYYYHEQ